MAAPVETIIARVPVYEYVEPVYETVEVEQCEWVPPPPPPPPTNPGDDDSDRIPMFAIRWFAEEGEDTWISLHNCGTEIVADPGSYTILWSDC